jgi:serine phosphatase RsbU (regulator of sigma subunit)
VPLAVPGEVLGVVTLSFPGRRRFDSAEREFLSTLGDCCAQALFRIRAEATAGVREDRLRFLADASARLASSLDYEATLSSVAQLAVPEFADWCVIQVLIEGELRPLAVAHPDTIQADRVRELQERFPPDPNAPRGAYHVARTGVPELLPEVTDDMLAQAARDAEHLQVLRELHFRSAVQAPLRVRDRVLGVITWVTGESGRRYGSEDLAFLEDLARHAALAIDNAELHSQLRDVSQRLQRAVMPARLTAPPSWEVSSRYLAAGRTDAGGDFYDLVVLDDGSFAVFVGDVMGRGVQAAATMAQMRAAIRTLVALNPQPQAVMEGLDQFFARYETEQLVTLVYALSEASGERLDFANAGHPAPVVLRGDGSSELVAAEDTLILGAGGADREVASVHMGIGDTVLLFTDGLIERRGEGIDDGHRRLLDAASAMSAGTANLDKTVTQLVEQVRDPSRDDDVAVVGLRRLR